MHNNLILRVCFAHEGKMGIDSDTDRSALMLTQKNCIMIIGLHCAFMGLKSLATGLTFQHVTNQHSETSSVVYQKIK